MWQKYITQHQEYQAVQGFWIWVQLVVLPAAWGYRQRQGWCIQKNWSHPLWGSLRATNVWGSSQGSGGAWTKVCWCSWSWKLVFVLRDDASPGMDGLLGGWTLKTPGLQVGGLMKELQVWQVQEALQWSGYFVGFTTRKYWQKMSVQSHFQHCILSARWLMENTLCVLAGPSDD